VVTIERREEVERVNMMLIELLYEKEVLIEELHARLREEAESKRCSIEHLCLCILGVRHLEPKLLRPICDTLQLEGGHRIKLGKAYLDQFTPASLG
jgi:hypothetical protein